MTAERLNPQRLFGITQDDERAVLRWAFLERASRRYPELLGGLTAPFEQLEQDVARHLVDPPVPNEWMEEYQVADRPERWTGVWKHLQELNLDRPWIRRAVLSVLSTVYWSRRISEEDVAKGRAMLIQKTVPPDVSWRAPWLLVGLPQIHSFGEYGAQVGLPGLAGDGWSPSRESLAEFRLRVDRHISEVTGWIRSQRLPQSVFSHSFKYRLAPGFPTGRPPFDGILGRDWVPSPELDEHLSWLVQRVVDGESPQRIAAERGRRSPVGVDHATYVRKVTTRLGNFIDVRPRGRRRG